jgi:Xaa-Pro aminopeptidase
MEDSMSLRRLAASASILIAGAFFFFGALEKTTSSARAEVPRLLESGRGQAIAAARDIDRILPHRDRARIENEWLEWRLENIVPTLMRREKIDMWLVINREYNEDPVYLTMVPRPRMASPGMSALIYHDRGGSEGVVRHSSGPGSASPQFPNIWTDRSLSQFDRLAQFIREANPRRIGINVSRNWAFGDGLSVSIRDRLVEALGTEFAGRLVSAEHLAVGWLETRSPMEISFYRHVAGIAHDLIGEFFSNRVIVPDVTTADDVVWWIRDRITGLGLHTWFQPTISIQRADANDKSRLIRRGDLLHCDVGIVYLGLHTDMQWQAYVLRLGETDAPAGLKHALDRANRVADILMGELVEGRTGREIAETAMAKAEAAGLRPLIYTHPIGVHGHGAGCFIDTRPEDRIDENNRYRKYYPLYPDTAYAIEFSSTTSVPEWGGSDVRIGFEETAIFHGGACRFADGRQTELLLIR